MHSISKQAHFVVQKWMPDMQIALICLLITEGEAQLVMPFVLDVTVDEGYSAESCMPQQLTTRMMASGYWV